MRPSVLRLGWSQWTIVAGGIATVLAVVWIAFAYSWADLYARQFALPRLQERYGFEFGIVTFNRAGVTYEWPGFVRLTLDGHLARMGVRERDVVFQHHGYGAWTLYSALQAGERGHTATFDVMNVDDWVAGRDPTPRTIQVPARPRAR